MDEQFRLKLSSLRFQRKKLIDLRDELDAEKRSIKTALRRHDNDENYMPELSLKGRKQLIRRLKDKHRYLVEERQIVVEYIREATEDQRELNISANTKKKGYHEAFVAAATRILDEDTLLEIDLRALNILDSI